MAWFVDYREVGASRMHVITAKRRAVIDAGDRIGTGGQLQCGGGAPGGGLDERPVGRSAIHVGRPSGAVLRICLPDFSPF
ncbi:hypothetical protein EDC02_5303 [Micromonospora sp. Llam0]|nr:hypothetical protein EDC02_5303 [Micromonospora sp. Llam0]